MQFDVPYSIDEKVRSYSPFFEAVSTPNAPSARIGKPLPLHGKKKDTRERRMVVILPMLAAGGGGSG